MGYTTEFDGSITIDPPLNAAEIEYLNKFASTRRMHRREAGAYFVDADSVGGQDFGNTDIINQNAPPPSQPGLWCQWIPNEDGTAIEWDSGEKFYSSQEWMTYLINHFLQPGALAKEALPFLQANHVLNGEILAQGEDIRDRWKLVVTNNVVTRVELQ